ncbi:hypothetical protein ACEYYB_11170 [Paracoccus sp. p4-l81]|uniref:hypothetical protein n=1 Tax=Paracoccus sp. p4-l81 TaxID=3342806 RepID=UPI0035B7DB04
MSAPDTDPERQVRRHWVPLIVMIVLVALTVLGFLWWVSDETDDPVMPGEAVQGEAVQTEQARP